ncbi:hypothetical protein ACFWZ3_07780 [Frateuria sp. GZRR35]|uniref:hypothetical protein n=1 Tax=unclassified Frateuria TaxID=2648894 RepID=UPI003EDB81BD
MSPTEQREGIEAGRLDMFVVPAVLGPASALAALLLPLSAPPVLWSLPGCLYVLMYLIGPLTTRFGRRHGLA